MGRGGRSHLLLERTATTRGAAIRSLLQRHRDVGGQRAALPLVARRLVEADAHGVGARLARVERAEVDVARERRRRHGGLVAVDGHHQLGRVGVAEVDLDAGERRADLDSSRDGAGVLHREVVHLGLAGSEVGVGQLERPGVVAVRQLDRQSAGLDRHVARVGGDEVRAGSGDAGDTGEADERSSDGGGGDLLGAGHCVPFLQPNGRGLVPPGNNGYADAEMR